MRAPEEPTEHRARHAPHDDTDEALRRSIRSYICERFLPLQPELEWSDDDELLEIGVIDSLAFIELVAEIQSTYGVTVRDVDVTRDNFGSVAAMAGYVRSRRSG